MMKSIYLILFLLIACSQSGQIVELPYKPDDDGELPVLSAKLKVAILPTAAKSPDLITEAQKMDQIMVEGATEAMKADPNLSVLLPTDVRRTFPEIRDSGDYEVLDYVKFRKQLGVDLIILTIANKPYPNMLRRTCYKISANSGRTIDARIMRDRRSQTIFEFASNNQRRFAKFIMSPTPQKVSSGEPVAQKECSRCDGKECVLNWGFRSDLDKISEKLTDDWDDSGNPSFAAGFTYSGPSDVGGFLSFPEQKLPYFLHTPPNFEKTKWGYPLLIYLHGTRAHNETLSSKLISESPLNVIYAFKNGEHSLELSRLNYLNKFLKSSFVLMPQASLSRIKDDPEELRLLGDLNKLIAEVLEKYPVDRSRVYITGLSQGGFRTWAYAELLADRIAAIAPVCGGDSFTYKCCMRKTAVWAHHSFDDKVVGIRQVSPMENMLPGRFHDGDINILEDYPFGSRRPNYFRDSFKDLYPNPPYLNPGEGSAADSDYTATFWPVRTGWKRGVNQPEGTIAYTMYNKSGHCPWPYANPGFWEWLYAQRRK